jgi:glycosyltransferase involved in cell wall biosynthesis
MKSTLVLFTFNPPVDSASEGAFLRVELEYLAKKFKRVILVPQIQETHIPSSFPCETDMSLAAWLKKPGSRVGSYLSALMSIIYWREVFRHRASLSREKLRTILWTFALGQGINKWFHDFCKREAIDLSQTVCYTYWFDVVGLGLSLVKRKNPFMKWISRAHRVDLYENKASPSFFPFREFMLRQIDSLYLISRDGLAYMSGKYPAFVDKYRVAKLGVRDGGFITESSPAGKIRIVSCSQWRSVKRIDLMGDGIKTFAGRHPALSVFWDHFGGGGSLGTKLPPNIVSRFWGNVPNQVVIDFYKTDPVDVFLNTSFSEGIPVSIMEAIASGIPVVAPAVGGIPEIVDSQNGILLNPDPTADEIANALEQFIPFSTATAQKKAASRVTWLEHYDADKNYDQFSADLAGLLEKP